jgi:hypothetical protein
LIWRFTLVLIKINYGQIGDQTGLFYATNPVFYTSGNIFVRRTGTFGNLIFSLVPSDNRNTISTCPPSVFTGIGQTLMSKPACWLRVHLLHLISIMSFKLGHVSIPKRRINDRVRKVPKIYYLNVWSVSDPIVEVNAVVRHFRLPWVLIRNIWQ